jgi:integrase
MTDPTRALNPGDILPTESISAAVVPPDTLIAVGHPGSNLASADAAPREEAATEDALAVVRRLARTRDLPQELVAVMNGPLADAVAVAAEYASDAITEATRAAYLGDWTEFAAWCRTQRIDPTILPIHPVLVAAYLAGLAGTVGRSALRRRVAAIVYHHRRRGLVWSSQQTAIRETLIGIARTHGKPVKPAAALTSVEIKQLIGSCADDLAGPAGLAGRGGLADLRDRALFLVGFAGALRRSELVAIDHHHLRFEADCVVIHIPRSKGDQEGKGADVTLPRMRRPDICAVSETGTVSNTCPVRALERWLKRARITRGPVFRGITAHGTIEGRLSADGVRKILLRRAAQAKLTVHPSERLSPHGLRAGLITEAYLAGAPDEQVMKHTRHADLSTMRGYRRRARVTADNPARLLDL